MSCQVFSNMQELRVLVSTTRVYHLRPSPGARADVDTRAKSGAALSWLMPAQLPHPLSKTTATPAVCSPQLDNVTLRHLDALLAKVFLECVPLLHMRAYSTDVCHPVHGKVATQST